MDIPPVSPAFGRHEFLIRRLHSLTGLFPVGAFLMIHLATNASILDGGDTYQARVNQIHSVGPSTLLTVEWIFIFLPIIFHALIGMLIVTRGQRNVLNYPYGGNVRYTLQRWTGVIAFFFIFWHVFQTRGWIQSPWWVEHVTRPLGGGLFDPKHAAISSADAVRVSIIAAACYLIGVLCQRVSSFQRRLDGRDHLGSLDQPPVPAVGPDPVCRPGNHLCRPERGHPVGDVQLPGHDDPGRLGPFGARTAHGLTKDK